MTARILLIAFLVLIAGNGAAVAQESAPVNAERPSFSSSPVALAPGLMQLEAGYQYTRASGTVDADDHTLPLALFRMGLAERLELQVSWAGISWSEVGGRNSSGARDAGIGVKWEANDPNAAVPLALFAGISVPIGDNAFSSNEVDPALGAFWSYSAGVDWFGTILLTDANDDASIGNAVGVSLPVNADTGSYVEYFGIYGKNSGSEHYLNGGLTRLAHNDLQYDLHLGVGLNSRAADLFIGFGLAYRF